MTNATLAFSTLALAGCSVGGALGSNAATAGEAAPSVVVPTTYNPERSLSPLVDAVEPAVVNVYVTSRTRVPTYYQFAYGMPSEQIQQGQGSGFVISADGYILTNNHVITGASDVKVKFDAGDEYPAKVVGADAGSDVALLKIEAGKPLPWLQLGDSEHAKVGDWVVAVGNPLGLGHTVTAGIISAKGREIRDLDALEEFIQTDASINPGNSGGPLIGLDGKVIGMNTAIVSGANSVGFAIPSDHLDWVLPQLRADGKVDHGWLGVQSAALNGRGLREYRVKQGVMVTDVTTGSPAAQFGFSPGDVITRIGDRDIAEPRDLFRAVASKNPGDVVSVAYIHNGAAATAKVTLGVRPTASR
jgi:serine protease Do